MIHINKHGRLEKKTFTIKLLSSSQRRRSLADRVLDLMFQYYMIEQDWAKAAEYVEKLGEDRWASLAPGEAWSDSVNYGRYA